jgi:hypothetical protein
MKQIIGSTCLAVCCLGVLWVEYQMVLHFRSILILFAVAPVLGALLIALFRAPEGYERPDGFHVRARPRRLSPISRVRLFQPARARGWR